MDKISDTIKQGLNSLKSIKEDKREYKKYEARVDALPQDYNYVFEKMTKYMWSFCGGGNGYDMITLHADLLDLFEAAALEGKDVLDVTGTDIAAFCDELLRNARTYTQDWRIKLNRDILKKLGRTE